MQFDRNRTLEELEGQKWGEPEFPSSLVTTCHRLRRKPLYEFSIEDLRIMIGQQIGLPYLVPMAIEQLHRQPLAEGDFYPGDLLQNVLRVEKAFWLEHPNQKSEVAEIRQRAFSELEQLDDHDHIVEEALTQASFLFDRQSAGL